MDGEINMQMKKIYEFGMAYSMSHNEDFFCSLGESVEIYSRQSGKLEHRFSDLNYPNHSKFLTQNQLIVKSCSGYYQLYDLNTWEKTKRISIPNCKEAQDDPFLITPDEKFLIGSIFSFPPKKLAAYDFSAQKWIDLNFIDIRISGRGILFYDSFLKKIIFVYSDESKIKEMVALIPYPFTGEYQFCTFYCSHGILSCDYCQQKLAINDFFSLTIIDVLTGDTIYSIPKPSLTSGAVSWSPTGRFLAFIESSHTIELYRTSNWNCISKFEEPGVQSIQFVDDDYHILVSKQRKSYYAEIIGNDGIF